MLALLFWWFSFPSKLFNDPYSTVLLSEDNQLLGAYIATDEQWRFPEVDSIPNKYEICVLNFEDAYFYYHWGVNPISIFKAAYQNIKAGKVVSGGSTISMQLIRLARKGKSRTVWQKIIETLWAIRLECSYSKEEILRLYVSHTPYGGNVVGLNAAAWRYFASTGSALSWGEAATLAVLPNSPSLIYPGKSNEKLLEKRNRLLDKLYRNKVLDEQSLQLAKLEPIPTKVHALPQLAPHLLQRVVKEHGGKTVHSTINKALQNRVSLLMSIHLNGLRANGVHNAAVLVLDIESGNVLAYVGNSPSNVTGEHGERVDVITSNRSSGSLLKPFLYACMQDKGLMLPTTLIADIPMQIAGFTPKNFDRNYSGAVPADKALTRSLNIPYVRMLRSYGVAPFYNKLSDMGVSTFSKPPMHYGLALILGGAEVNMWEMAGIYSSMARSVIHYNKHDGVVYKDNYRMPSYIAQEQSNIEAKQLPISVGAAWLTIDALRKLNRPESEAGWRNFASSRAISWKTGTSFGFRDAWSIGMNGKYLVAVWCGNADGEGRPELTGTTAASPIMFDIFSHVEGNSWGEIPIDELIPTEVCSRSGFCPSLYCDKVDTIWAAPLGEYTENCPYHELVHLDETEKWQVKANCYTGSINTKPWFNLPPVIEWYYKRTNLSYQAKPPMHPDCFSETASLMDFIYPRDNNVIFIPKQLGGTDGVVVLNVVHQQSQSEIHWHLNDTYLGKTTNIHQMPIQPAEGKYLITLVDDKGNTKQKSIEVVGKP